MPGNLLRAHVRIVGVKPLLWHRFGPDAIPLEKQEKTGVAGNDPHEWKRTVLYTKDWQLYIPASYIFGALREAARFTKRGRGTLQPLIVACLDVSPEVILIDRWLPDGLNGLPMDPTEPVYLDVRSVVNPATRARNVRYRVGASPGWHAEFTLQWDKTIVSRAEMQAVLIDAGRLVGIGSGHVTRSGGGIGMGRFEVERFEVEDVAA